MGGMTYAAPSRRYLVPLNMPPLNLDQLLDAERRLDFEHRLARQESDVLSACLTEAGLVRIRRKIASIVDQELEKLDLTPSAFSGNQPASGR
jgi:hypothetical protein